MQTNLTWKKTLAQTTWLTAILLPIVIITGCCGASPGTEKPFLIVNELGGGSSQSPYFEVQNIGDEAVTISFFRFEMRAEGAVTVTPPENCDVMYDDQPEEGVLIVHCQDLVIPAHGIKEFNIPITGPWNTLHLTSILARDEAGNEVWNNLSANHPPFWNNPDPSY